MSHPISAEHVRVPAHLSEAALQLALLELDSKIRTLRNRAHATVAGSSATYPQHADALEAKRAHLLRQLGEAAAAPGNSPPTPATRSTWEEIWRGVENLRDDLRNII